MGHKKLGIIVPSSNTILETEFHRMVPKDVTVHVSRMRLKKDNMLTTIEEVEGMERDAEKAAVELSDAHVNVIGYGCTTGSHFKGNEGESRIVERLEKATATPVVTTFGCIVKALQTFRARKVLVATPYIEETNIRLKKHLEQAGFEVVRLLGLGLDDNLAIGNLDPTVTYDLVAKLDGPDADAALISCTNVSSAEIVQKLEDMIRKPVISSNTATLWGMLRRIGYSNPISGYGILLREKH